MHPSHKGFGRRDHVVLFDVTPASIGAAVIHVANDTPTMLWSTRGSLPLQEDLEYERFVRALFATFLEVSMRTMTEGIPGILRTTSIKAHDLGVVVVLSSPWFLGAVRVVTIEKEQGFSATTTLLSDRLAAAKEELLASTEITSYRDVVRSADILDADILDVCLDGYSTRNYLNRNTKELQFATYFSITSPEILGRVRELVDTSLPNAPVSITTSTRLLYYLIQSKLPRTARAIVVEATGEVTVVSLVQEGRLCATRTFPCGTNHFLRSVANDDKGVEHARGILSLLASKLATREGFPTTLTDTLDEWTAQYRDVVCAISEGVTPPRNVMLVADRQWEDWLQSMIRAPWTRPGIRTELGQRVMPLTVQPEGAPSQVDQRLDVLARGLSTAAMRSKLLS